jgi:hypothetical protein
MAQIIIDVGQYPNDGQGDPLRTAFSDINVMFSEVYTSGPVNSNVRIANNTITTTVLNSNLVLAPSGIGKVTVNNSLVPSIDNVYDLGSPTRRFNTIYIGTGDLDISGTISTTGNVIASYFVGDGSQLSNVGATTTFSSLPPANPQIGAVWIDSSSAVQYIYFNDGTGSQWAEMEAFQSFSAGSSGNATPGGISGQVQFNNSGLLGGSSGLTFSNSTGTLSVTANISAGNILTNNFLYANGQPFFGSGSNLLAISSNVVAATTATYGLGTSAVQWKNLWVSDTAYINSVPLTASGTSLSVNGSPVLTSANANIGNITFNGATGNIIINGASAGKSIVWDFSGDGGTNTFITAGTWKNYGPANITTNSQGPGPSKTFVFGADGILTLPVQLSAPTVSVTGNVQGGNLRTTGLISASGGVTAGAGFVTAGNVTGGNINTSGSVNIGTLLSAPPQTKTATSTGLAGQICWDDNYIYVCTATNTWKRVALIGGY